MQKHDSNPTFHLWCMNIWVQRLDTYLFKWESNFCLEVFQMLFLDLDSLNNDYGTCLNAWNGLQPPETCSGMAAVVSLVWDLMMMILCLQVMYECLDSSYVIYGWCLNDKKGKCTSGLRVCLIRLNMCFNGGWRVILSFWCFCDVWMIQTTFKWCLESVWSIGLVRNCKGWKLGF